MDSISPATEALLQEMATSCDQLDDKLSRMAQDLRTTVLRLARDREVPNELAERLREIANDAADVRDRRSA